MAQIFWPIAFIEKAPLDERAKGALFGGERRASSRACRKIRPTMRKRAVADASSAAEPLMEVAAGDLRERRADVAERIRLRHENRVRHRGDLPDRAAPPRRVDHRQARPQFARALGECRTIHS